MNKKSNISILLVFTIVLTFAFSFNLTYGGDPPGQDMCVNMENGECCNTGGENPLQGVCWNDVCHCDCNHGLITCGGPENCQMDCMDTGEPQ